MIKKRHEHLDILINNAGIYMKPDPTLFYEQVTVGSGGYKDLSSFLADQ
jgi:hypothetical protein